MTSQNKKMGAHVDPRAQFFRAKAASIRLKDQMQGINAGQPRQWTQLEKDAVDGMYRAFRSIGLRWVEKRDGAYLCKPDGSFDLPVAEIMAVIQGRFAMDGGIHGIP